ncbi:MAG: hypothetical protein JST30_06520 [Armatimonadetes bacterium]|nr:hypothetical protein [Armatimonadota bacterium]
MNLHDFREAHLDLRRIVNDAIAYGPDPSLCARFRTCRAVMQANYGLVRSAFGMYWTTSDDPRRFPTQHSDPFERILSAPDLPRLLSRDANSIRRDLDDMTTAFEWAEEARVPIA